MRDRCFKQCVLRMMPVVVIGLILSETLVWADEPSMSDSGRSAAVRTASVEPASGRSATDGTDTVKSSAPYTQDRYGRWSAGAGSGILFDTPDGTAFGVDAHADYFVSENVSLGPLLQLGFTDDMTQVGISGQGKYWADLPGTNGRDRLSLQSGIGFIHADVFRSDTSWLVPLGIGYGHTLDSGVELEVASFVNFTDLHTGFGTGADVMPGFRFGVRF